MIPLLVREMLPEERSLVLSDWKKDLWDSKPAWGRALQAPEWWALINHVIDQHTLPSAHVWMACHRNEPSVSLAWLAVRATRPGLILAKHATKAVHEEPELAAFLERTLLEHTSAYEGDWNPFLDLTLSP